MLGLPIRLRVIDHATSSLSARAVEVGTVHPGGTVGEPGRYLCGVLGR